MRFNGPILRALTDIIVERGRGRHVFPAPGSRDALCELIEAKLESIEINESRAMTLHFDKGRAVIIPLTTDDKTGPEAAHFVPGENQPIFVW